MESMIEEEEIMCPCKLVQSTPLSKFRAQTGMRGGGETLNPQSPLEVFILRELLDKETITREEHKLLP